MGRTVVSGLLVGAMVVASGCGSSNSNSDPGDGSDPGSGSNPGSGSDPGDGSAQDPPPVAPADLQVTPGERSCALRWAAATASIDSFDIKVDRGDWQLLSDGDIPVLGTATTAEISTQAPELTTVDIQLRARKGAQLSEPSTTVHCALPLIAPRNAMSMMWSGGVVVNWTNDSLRATTIEIERAELDASGAAGTWAPLVTLPATSEPFGTTYVDTTATTVGKGYDYRVTAVFESMPSASAVLPGLRRGPPLTASTVKLPAVGFMITDGNGHYAYPAPGSDGQLSFLWGDGSTWTTGSAVVGRLFSPGIQLDAAGLPHAVYGRPVGQSVDIIHGWTDGTAWHEETVARRALGSDSLVAPLQFALDPTGTPVMMWAMGGEPFRFEAAMKVDGGWTIAPIGDDVDASIAGLGDYTLFVDQAGTAHVLSTDLSSVWHFQGTRGAWTHELVPVLPFRDVELGYWPMMGAGSDPDHLTLCFQADPTDFWAQQAGCIRKTPTGWLAFERLGGLPANSVIDSGWIALSPDGMHVAAVYQDGDTHVFRASFPGPATGPGGWTEAVHQTTGPLLVGFDASNRLFVFSNPNQFYSGPPTPVDYPLLRE